MASYSITYTSDSVTFRVTGLVKGQTVRFFLRYDPDSGSAIEDETLTAGSTAMTQTYSGLEEGKKYAVNVQVNGSGWIGKKTFTTPASSPTPGETFAWTYAGLDSDGIPMAGEEKIAGLGIYVTADEWNELAALVSDATGQSVSEVSSGDPISAAVVNTMARALGVKTVSPEDPIKASFFNELKDAYNTLT